MEKVTVSGITAMEILDSRGNPTLEARVTLSDGSTGCASVPSGASTGSHEAFEKRDGDASRYRGKGVLGAVGNVSGVIRDALIGIDAYDQRAADRIMIALDGTRNKSNLGANAILSVSLALANAAAESLRIPLFRYLGGTSAGRLPVPMMNILNGGAHASNNIDIQEFMIVPHGMEDFGDGLRAGAEIYASLRSVLGSRGLSTAVGDEGGFAPDLSGDEEAIELICLAIERAGYSTDEVGISLDAAAGEWQNGEGYRLPKRGTELSSGELIGLWEDLTAKYPILSIEDGLGEEDFSAWNRLTVSLGNRILLVGDDLFVTDTERLRMGIREESANAILIKPNQIGTLTETLEVIAEAQLSGYRHILSHRSGDTPDTTIADIAVATSALLIKTGAPCRGERIAKYNRLSEIALLLGSRPVYGF